VSKLLFIQTLKYSFAEKTERLIVKYWAARSNKQVQSEPAYELNKTTETVRMAYFR